MRSWRPSLQIRPADSTHRFVTRNFWRRSLSGKSGLWVLADVEPVSLTSTGRNEVKGSVVVSTPRPFALRAASKLGVSAQLKPAALALSLHPRRCSHATCTPSSPESVTAMRSTAAARGRLMPMPISLSNSAKATKYRFSPLLEG
eukprot:6193911-Pleurochrysis_carterae.AAC.5